MRGMTEESFDQLKKEVKHPEALDQIFKEARNSYFQLKDGEVRIEDHIKLRPDFYSLAWLY